MERFILIDMLNIVPPHGDPSRKKTRSG